MNTTPEVAAERAATLEAYKSAGVVFIFTPDLLVWHPVPGGWRNPDTQGPPSTSLELVARYDSDPRRWRARMKGGAGA